MNEEMKNKWEDEVHALYEALTHYVLATYSILPADGHQFSDEDFAKAYRYYVDRWTWDTGSDEDKQRMDLLEQYITRRVRYDEQLERIKQMLVQP